MAKLEISVTLEQQQLDWLQSMATKYNLPTADKALRIVLIYGKQVKVSAAPAFKELASRSPAHKSPVTGKHAIDEVHDTFLEELKGSYNLSSKDQKDLNGPLFQQFERSIVTHRNIRLAVHVILEYCMSHADERTLFEVKRCRHGDTCKNC